MKAVFVAIAALFFPRLAIPFLLSKGVDTVISYKPKRWVFDKTENVLVADRVQLAPLSVISEVQARQVRRHRELAIALSDGRQLKIGTWRKEWAWRQDAAQIAAFLQVPLEIPPVLPNSMDG